MNWDKESKDNQEKKVPFVFIIILIIIAILFVRDKNNVREFILADYSYTPGVIIEAYNIDGNTNLKYQYKVEGRDFVKNINPVGQDYNDCPDNFELCDTLSFWIAYSNSKPDLNMIDLSLPIMEDEDPYRTRSIGDLEFSLYYQPFRTIQKQISILFEKKRKKL